MDRIQLLTLRIPLFWIALSAVFGILAADTVWYWCFATIATAAIGLRKHAPSLWLVGGIVASFLLFYLAHHSTISKIAKFPLSEALDKGDTLSIKGSGWIASDTNRLTGQRLRIVLELSSLWVRETRIPLENSHRVIALIDHSETESLNYGDGIEFSGRLKKIDPAKSPGAFDPSKYFYRSANAIAEISINKGDRCQRVQNFGGAKLVKWAIESRKQMEIALGHGVKEEYRDKNGVILAMALGAREKSPEDIEDAFRLSGTMHIFAVSGLHVGVVAAMFWFILKWLGFSRRNAVLIIIPAVLFYALLTGLRPSSFRAAVMLSTFLAGFALKRRPSPVNGIGLAAIIILATNSQQLFLPGFQLSFAVVIALTVVGSFFSDKLYQPFRVDEFIPKRRVALWRLRTDKTVKILTMGLGVSLATWLGSVILMNTHFSGISPIGLIANVIMVPIASAIVVIAGISILFFGIKLSIVSIALNYINLLMASLLAFLAQFFAGMPGAHIHTGYQTIPHTPESITLDVMGIRGGGATLVASKKQTWLLDSGGGLTFRQQVLPLLRERGINRLDGLVLSHGDSGHIGEAAYLLNHITPSLVLETPFPNRARVYPQINTLLESKSINRIQVIAGQKLRWSQQTYWEPLYPDEHDPPTGVADDRCLVMRLKSGPWKILFTFDAGFLIERQLINEHWNLESDIWIRGQHSTTRSGTIDFVEQVNPSVIISTNERFPPHEKLSPEWIETIRNLGIELITLDQAGSVNLQISRERALITPFLGQGAIELKH